MNPPTTKYAIVDPDFFPKVLAETKNEKERGMIVVLYCSGMHVSSLIELSKSNLKKVGNAYRLEWRRTKTGKAMSCNIPSKYHGPVAAFLESRKPSRQYIHRIIKEMGAKAGYENISPMTFRHSRCVRAFLPKEQGGEGMPFFVVNQLLGCSMGVITRNYAIMTDGQVQSYDDKWL